MPEQYVHLIKVLVCVSILTVAVNLACYQLEKYYADKHLQGNNEDLNYKCPRCHANLKQQIPIKYSDTVISVQSSEIRLKMEKFINEQEIKYYDKSTQINVKDDRKNLTGKKKENMKSISILKFPVNISSNRIKYIE